MYYMYIIPFLMPFLKSTIVLPSLLPTTNLLHLLVYYSPPYAFSHILLLALLHITFPLYSSQMNGILCFLLSSTYLLYSSLCALCHISTVFSFCFLSHIYCILLLLLSVSDLPVLYIAAPWSPAHTAETSPQGVVIPLQPSRHNEPLPQCWKQINNPQTES